MDKKEVEEILIRVKLGQDEALSMKIYKSGIICRRGCGAAPELGISTMTFTGNSAIFDKLMETISQQICDLSIKHEDKKTETPLEYTLCFYGVSSNGETGERAQWKKSSGINILIDSNSDFRDPILDFIDNLAMDACEITNSIYFDVMIKSMYSLTSTSLPESIISTPKTEAEIRTTFENYVDQINNSVRKWDIISFGNEKKYMTSDGIELKPSFSRNGHTHSFRFFPITFDAEKYDKGLEEFNQNEEIALQLFPLLDSDNKKSASFITDTGIPTWKRNLEILDQLDKIEGLYDNFKKQNQILRKCCELRIESFDLIYKGLIEQTSAYNDKIEDITKSIDEVVEQLGKNVC